MLGPGAASYDVDSVSAGHVSRRCRRCRPALQLLQIEVAVRILQQAHPVARLVAPRPVVLHGHRAAVIESYLDALADFRHQRVLVVLRRFVEVAQRIRATSYKGIGREKPYSTSSPTGDASTSASTAAYTR